MQPLDAAWHLLDFFAPALGIGVLTPLLAKLLWRRELRGAGLARLVAVATTGAVLALVGGLVVFGHDGKMATYGAMLLACALGLWWAGFFKRRG